MLENRLLSSRASWSAFGQRTPQGPAGFLGAGGPGLTGDGMKPVGEPGGAGEGSILPVNSLPAEGSPSKLR